MPRNFLPKGKLPFPLIAPASRHARRVFFRPHVAANAACCLDESFDAPDWADCTELAEGFPKFQKGWISAQT